MKSFEKKFLASIRIDNELLKVVREIGEYRGKEDLVRLLLTQVANIPNRSLYHQRPDNFPTLMRRVNW